MPLSRTLTRYLLRRMAAALGVTLLLLVGLVFLLQALRLGHHVAGAGLGPGLLGRVLLLSLPFLVVFALPFALGAAILLVLGQLSDETAAMRAAGAAPLDLALAPLLLGLAGAALVAGVAGRLEAPALAALERVLCRGATEALVRSIRPGRFLSLSDDVTLYAERRRPSPSAEARLEGLLLAQDAPGRLLLARRARLSAEASGERVALELEHGELQMQSAEGRLRRVRFDRLRLGLDLGDVLRPHFAFLGRRAREPGRPLAAPAAALALALFAAAVGLRASSRMRMAILGLAGLLLHQGLVWAAGLLWPGPAGALGVSAGLAALSLGWLSLEGSRGRGARELASGDGSGEKGGDAPRGAGS